MVRIHLAVQTHSLLLYPGHLYTFVNSGILPKRHTNKVVFSDCVFEHKHPFRAYTEVGYSLVANKLTFICMYSLESAAAPVIRPQAGGTSESHTVIYIIACKSMLCVFSISLFWTLYHVYALKCAIVWQHVYMVYVGFFTRLLLRLPTHLYNTTLEKKRNVHFFFNLYISNRVRSQQMALQRPSRRPHNVDRHYLKSKLQFHLWGRRFITHLHMYVSQIF